MIKKNGYVDSKLGVQYEGEANVVLSPKKHSYEYCIVFAAIVITVAHGLLKQARHNQGNYLGLTLIYRQSQNLHLALVLWIVLFLCALFQFWCFALWAKWRFIYKNYPLKRKRWNNLWLNLYISYVILIICGTSISSIYLDLKALPSLMILNEMCRLLMKGHAFIRTNIEAEINLQHLQDRKKHSFSHYIYFLFAPTLVYKDTYRRTSSIKWMYVLRCACEFSILIVAVSCVFEKVYLEPLKVFVQKPYNVIDGLIFILENCVSAIFILVAIFCCILHIWQSAFAEMLRFEDRLFFSEWWYSKSFKDFHRLWNHLVQNWLYINVYKDFYKYVVPNNRTAAKFAVFFISCLLHEVVLSFSFRMFLPMFFIEFYLSGMVITLELKNPFLGNLFFWVLLALSSSSMITCYTIQYWEKELHNNVIGVWWFLVNPLSTKTPT